MTAEDKTNEESLDERVDPRSLSIQGSVGESNIVVGDRNVINQGPSYYTTNVFGTFEPEQFSARPSQRLSQDEYRWRQVLVQNVKRYWIEGVLERSLHNQVLIELGLEERVQAVVSPIGAAEEFIEDAGRPFPAGTQATDIFDGLGAGRTLLILGEPGAGKTTTLLKLTKTLIARIGDDFSQPIPVVLNLSSWAKKRQPIEKWLVQDLYETFQVSKSLGTTWIQEEQLTLCLDGLDEVATQHRNGCLQALNQFLQSHGRTEVVVCSRIRNYEALSNRLKVKCAIYVQPLTSRQVNQYLEQAGEQLSALKQLLSRSSEIKAFAASPLTLSVMSLAYQGSSFNEFSIVNSTQDFRQQLFDTYIERMLLRREKVHDYTDQQAKYWLAWMAQQMVETSQTVFFMENMQPSWLQTRAQRLRYRLESSLIVGLIVGLIIGLGNRLIIRLNNWLSYELVIRQHGLNDKRIYDVIEGLNDGLSSRLISGLNDGLIIGLIVGLIALTSGKITRVETLKWSWKAAKNFCRDGLIAGLIAGLIVGLGNGLIVGLIVGLIAGLNSGLLDGLITGLNGGILVGLIGGGSACLRHFSLRWMLYRMGYIPWNYARFLNYATGRLFLQKVGGGHIFIHRMLLEHFAQMKLEQKPSK